MKKVVDLAIETTEEELMDLMDLVQLTEVSIKMESQAKMVGMTETETQSELEVTIKMEIQPRMVGTIVMETQ